MMHHPITLQRTVTYLPFLARNMKKCTTLDFDSAFFTYMKIVTRTIAIRTNRATAINPVTRAVTEPTDKPVCSSNSTTSTPVKPALAYTSSPLCV